MERIGLQAELDTSQYTSGVNIYLNGLSSMESQTGSTASTLSSQFVGLGQSVLDFGVGAAGLAWDGIKALTEALYEFGAAAVEEGMAYTQAMSNVAAITQATDEEFQNLMMSAEGLGRTTKFTATEAAEGMSYLAMAGFEAEEVISAMPGVLNLAAAGNLDLAKSADIVSNVMTGFGSTAEETQRYVDVLTKTFISSNTNLTQLGYGMKYVAPIANDLGVAVEDTAAAMGALGDAGIQGTSAGTALRAILLRLAAPVGAAADTIKELGVNLFDAQGQMLPFPQIVGNFNTALAGLTDQQKQVALKTIFGQRAVAAFSVLLKKGEGGLITFGDELRAAQEDFDGIGTAAGVAQTQLNNLSGDVTLFKSALSGIKIDVFKAMEPILRAIVAQGKLLLETYGPQLAAAFGEVVTVVTDFISRGEELFAIFQRGGLPAIAESLGITPQAIELLDKIKTDLFGIGDAVGTSVGPVLQWLADNVMAGLNTAIEFLNQHWEEFKGAIIGVGAVLASAAIAAIIAGIVTVLGTILSPIGLLIAAAGLLGAAWAGNWFGIRDTTIAAWTAIQPTLIQIQAGLLTLWEIAKAVWAGIVAAMQPAIESIMSAFANITQGLENMGLSWGQVGQAILTAIGIVAAGVAAAALAILSVILGLINGVAAMMENMTAAWARMTEAVMLIVNGFGTQLAGWIEVVRGILNLDMAQIANGFVMVWEGVQQLWSGIWQAILATLQATVGNVLALVGGLVDGIVSFWSGLYETLVGGSIIPEMVTSIIDWFNQLVGPIVSALEGLSSKVTEIFSGIFSLLGGGGGDGGGSGGGLFNLDLSGFLNQVRELVPAISSANDMVLLISSSFQQMASILGTSTQTTVKKFIDLMLSGFTPVNEQVQAIVLAITSLATTLLPELATATTDTAQKMTSEFQAVENIMSTIANAVSVIQSGLLSLTSSLVSFSEALQNASEDADDLADALGDVDDAAGDAASAFSSFNNARKTIDTLNSSLSSILLVLKSITEAAKAAGDALGNIDAGDLAPGSPSPLEMSLVGINAQLERMVGNLSGVNTVTNNTNNTTNQIFNISFASGGLGLNEAQAALFVRQDIQRQLQTL